MEMVVTAESTQFSMEVKSTELLYVQTYSVSLRAEAGWSCWCILICIGCSRRGKDSSTFSQLNPQIFIFVTSMITNCIVIYHNKMPSLKKAVSESSMSLPHLCFGLDRSQKMRDPHVCLEGSQRIQASRCILQLPEVRSWESWKTLSLCFLYLLIAL